MTMGERIKKVRKTLDLTQQEFADKIGSKRNTVATYEMGRTVPSTAVISLVCKTFNVNETWLRTGEGEMLIQQSRDDELAAFMDKLLADENTNFRRRFVTALSRLKPEQWDALEAVALELMKNSAVQAFAPADISNRELTFEREVEREIDQEVERYRDQLLSEKEQASQASSVRESGAD